jgi:uncharacterized protein YbjT (DUF2867 family)
VATQLLNAGATIRLGVRNPEKLASFKEKGTEVVAFDYEDVSTTMAFDSVETVVLITPFRGRLLQVHNRCT